jgi:nickel-dependent lactate racemase
MLKLKKKKKTGLNNYQAMHKAERKFKIMFISTLRAQTSKLNTIQEEMDNV